MTAAGTRARGRLTEDELRAALTELGLREEDKPIEGYGFTYRKEPRAAVAFWREQHSDVEPTRFYIAQQMFILSD